MYSYKSMKYIINNAHIQISLILMEKMILWVCPSNPVAIAVCKVQQVCYYGWIEGNFKTHIQEG